MGIKKVGNWSKVALVIGNLANEMKLAQELSLKRWGLKAEGLAKKHITAQDLGWQKLDPKTIAEKIRKGYSENILIATSSYFQSITSWTDKNVALAGVKKGVTNQDGEEIANIAAVHEFGGRDGNMPARPLWQPVFKETMEWFVTSDSTPDAIFKKNIKKYL